MKVSILGLGLIGGSLARAYKKAGHCVYAYDCDDSILAFSQIADVVDAPLTAENLQECELVLLSIYAEASANW